MNLNRNILFIGHANPEDNDFTLWIRQKLINEGYKSECDLTILIGGENDYWKDIQECLEVSACKYLLVLSNKTFKKQGVIDEWEHVRSIIKKNGLNDFIIPLRIDEVDFDTRIGLNRINIIDFSRSWAAGLRQLIKKLEKDSIPKSDIISKLSIMEWLNNKNALGQGIEKKKETYFSNWLKIHDLPKKYYVFEYANDKQANFISSHMVYPSIVHDKYVITFENEIGPQVVLDDSLFNKEESLIEYKSKKEVLIEVIKNNIELNSFPSLQDSKNFLIRLLKNSIDKYLTSKHLNSYNYSGSKVKCYYYEKMNTDNNADELETYEAKTFDENIVDEEIPYKVIFPYQEYKKRKKLVGKYYDSFWHLGISIRVVIFPIWAYEIKTHIVFSDDGINIWDDENKLHRARRNKGKRFFNEHWRDLLFAFLYSIKTDSNTIDIPVTKNNSIELALTPLSFISNVGYKEPDSKARLVPINEFLEEDDDDESDTQFSSTIEANDETN